jgi:hypothetical protein
VVSDSAAIENDVEAVTGLASGFVDDEALGLAAVATDNLSGSG